ncbi:MAG: hypothetical protein V4710_13740 [Verrucomicrobiota bacterium]
MMLRPPDISLSLAAFIDRLETVYTDRVQPYGGGISAHGFGFRLRGTDATFSVLTLDGALPYGYYDVQIESYPPGDYVYADEHHLDDLLQLIARVVGGDWP